MNKVKITDAELKVCIESGMSAAEIADKYGINKNYVYIKLKRIKERENKQNNGSDIKLMDTVVRKSDRKRFRVTAIDTESVMLKETTGDYGHASQNAITVSMNELAKKFEKKNYPEVKVYKMDEQLEKTVSKRSRETAIKDSGERETFYTGAVRDVRGGKGRCDLLPACAILRLAKHYEAGAENMRSAIGRKGYRCTVFWILR